MDENKNKNLIEILLLVWTQFSTIAIYILFSSVAIYTVLAYRNCQVSTFGSMLSWQYLWNYSAFQNKNYFSLRLENWKRSVGQETEGQISFRFTLELHIRIKSKNLLLEIRFGKEGPREVYSVLNPYELLIKLYYYLVVSTLLLMLW